MVEDTKGEIPTQEKETNLVDEARIEREKIEKAVESMKAENERAEKLAVQRELSGKSKGAAVKEKTEMEKYSERAEERYRGTGLNPSKGYSRKFE